MKLKEVYEKWYDDHRQYVKESTSAAYLQNYMQHIDPLFGKKEVEEITQKIVHEYAIEKYKAGLSRKSVGDILILMNMIIKYAGSALEMNVHMISINVKYPMEIIRPVDHKKNILSQEEFNRLMRYTDGHPSYISMSILLCMSSGMRIGELCGLKFSDVNFDTHSFVVKRTYERIYDITTKKTKLIFSTPKTEHSCREVPMIPRVEKIIKDFSKVSNQDYYLASGTTTPIEPRYMRTHIYQTQIQAGIERPVRPHGLRHTFATNMISNGVDVKTVAEILGHSNVATTLQMYTHPTQETKRKAINSVMKKMKI